MGYIFITLMTFIPIIIGIILIKIFKKGTGFDIGIGIFAFGLMFGIFWVLSTTVLIATIPRLLNKYGSISGIIQRFKELYP